MSERETGWERRLAYVLLRLMLGLDFLGHGGVRLMHGDGVFAAGMVKMMADTPLPGGLVHVFGLVLPFVELTVGLLLVLGVMTREALILGSVVMLSLMFGTVLRQDWNTAGLQLNYSVVFSLLLFLRASYDTSWWGLFKIRKAA
jgi:thiosulfate dehydrogenase [quinone] large subunit